MKSLSKLALCLLLAMSLTVSAFAAQVPDSLVAFAPSLIRLDYPPTPRLRASMR